MSGTLGGRAAAERPYRVVRAAEAVVAVGGEWGTLSEIALARKIGRPVALLGKPPVEGMALPVADGPAEAAVWALQAARRGREKER